MLAVTTKANTTALTTMRNLKLELDIDTRKHDLWLKTQIDAVSNVACEVLGVEMAEDGTRNLGVEALSETLDRRTRYPWLPPLGVIRPRREADTTIVVSRRPVISISSITENGTAVDPDDYELSATDGKIKRLSSGLPAAWPCTIIVIAYQAGWYLPGDNTPNMPAAIEQGVIEGVRARWYARKRDPNVRMQAVEGVIETQYFFGSPGADQPLPPLAMAMLNPYRNMSL